MVGLRRQPIVLALLALLAWPSRADAHGALKRSEPAAGASLAAPPSELRLEFSSRVELRLARVSLTGPGDRPVSLSPARLGNDAGTIVTVAPEAVLPAGRYLVRWQIAGADGHPTRGSFAFFVTGGGTAPEGVAESAGRAAPSGVAAASRDSVATPGAPATRPREDRGAAPRAVTSGADSATPAPPLGSTDASFDEQSPGYVAVRWIQYVAAFLLIGGFVFIWLIVARVAAPDADARDFMETTRARSLRLTRLASVVVLLAQGARLWAQRATMRGGSGDGLDISVVDLLVGTSWGTGWLFVVAGAAIALLAVTPAERAGRSRTVAPGHPMEPPSALPTDGLEPSTAPPDLGRDVSRDHERSAEPRTILAPWCAVAGGAAIAIGLALSGHQAASPLGMAGVAIDALHVAGTAGWIGTLGTLVFAALVPLAGNTMSHAGVAVLLRRFSRVVLVSAAIGGSSGVVLAAVNVGSFSGLWGGGYGRVLLLKLGVLSLVAATGAYNWRRVVPALGSEGATRALRRSASAEAVIALLVIAVTSVLVATPPVTMP